MRVGCAPGRCTARQRQNRAVRRHGSLPEEDMGLGQRQDFRICNLTVRLRLR